MNTLDTYIKNLVNINDPHEVIESLRKDSSLSNPEKNLVYLYLYPRPLLDRELPGRIVECRRMLGNDGRGFLEPRLEEVALIVEAYRTQQYRRFIKHLLHTFTVPENISPIIGYESYECALCGKGLFGLDAWNNECSKYKTTPHPESTRKEYLAFGGTGSNLEMCLDCMIQLQEANQLLELIEPGYLKNPWKNNRKQPV